MKSKNEGTRKRDEVGATKPHRNRLPVTITLSREAIEKGGILAKLEGGTLSRLIERWILNAFREGGLTLAGE